MSCAAVHVPPRKKKAAEAHDMSLISETSSRNTYARSGASLLSVALPAVCFKYASQADCLWESFKYSKHVLMVLLSLLSTAPSCFLFFLSGVD